MFLLFSKGLALLSGSLVSEGGLVDWSLLKFNVLNIVLATLYMAINEIRASAKETGMKFWEYGM